MSDSVDENNNNDENWKKESKDFLEEIYGPPVKQNSALEESTEPEKLYANLLMKTDFEDGFIEEMLEFEPTEEQRMRIDEIVRRERELKELANQQIEYLTQTGFI